MTQPTSFSLGPQPGVQPAAKHSILSPEALLGELQMNRTFTSGCLSLVVAYAGDLEVGEKMKSAYPSAIAQGYRYILEEFRGQQLHSRFIVEIPENLPPEEC